LILATLLAGLLLALLSIRLLADLLVLPVWILVPVALARLALGLLLRLLVDIQARLCFFWALFFIAVLRATGFGHFNLLPCR
jgi:hypothetical protein